MLPLISRLLPGGYHLVKKIYWVPALNCYQNMMLTMIDHPAKVYFLFQGITLQDLEERQ